MPRPTSSDCQKLVTWSPLGATLASLSHSLDLFGGFLVPRGWLQEIMIWSGMGWFAVVWGGMGWFGAVWDGVGCFGVAWVVLSGIGLAGGHVGLGQSLLARLGRVGRLRWPISYASCVAGGAELVCGHDNLLGSGCKIMMRLLG